MSESSIILPYSAIMVSIYLSLYLPVYTYYYPDTVSREEKLEVDRWLRENSFESYKKLFESQGRHKLVHMATIDAVPLMTALEEDRLKRASLSLKEKLIFAQYLKSLDLHQYMYPMLRRGLSSLEDVYSQNDAKIHEILGNDFATWTRGRQMLPSTKEALETFKSSLWRTLISLEETEHMNEVLKFRGCLLIISAFLAAIFTLTYKCILLWGITPNRSLLHAWTGRYLEPKMCLVNFHWSDPYPVGETLTFTIEFFQKNGLPYPVCDKDEVQVEITLGVRKVHSVISLGGTAITDVNLGQVKFSVRYAGIYLINITVRDEPVPGSPFMRKFLPGPVDATKTRFARQTSTVICCPDETRALVIEPRDSFQNVCISRNVEESSNYVDLDLYHSVVKQDGVENLDVCFQSFTWDRTAGRIFFEMTFLQEGYYNVEVYYHNTLIQNGDFTCIVLSYSEFQQASENVKNRNISHDVMLTRIEGEPCLKPKRVIMHITPKQFTVKEFVFKFLMKRIATYRVCPSTKLQILEETCNGVPMFSIEDGCQPTIYLAAFNRNVIVATYSRVLLNNIGGSETFTEKQYFFYCEVRRHHQKFRHEPITIKVDRQKLLQSSFKATKSFTLKDWCSNFEVIFQGEIGVDWGGLRREWFQLTCEALFSPGPENLFKGFSDNSQALVHPNRNRAPHFKLKYYEFAGRLLGKSLYETALGGSYSQFITAKFTRSFLAQLIGLRVNHSYFQSDDSDLYINKVQYILDNDVNGMDLYFTDEEYGSSGQLIKIVDLIPNGSKIKVTNSTKRQYLDHLAQYRLATSVKEEIETFLKGLNDIIPDNFLCMFDENELELLLCGTGEYSISDFRAHHIVNAQYPRTADFDRILKWFWIAVSNFTTEEMARLLQFTTGSSQLPPGGFKDLNPQFQIMPSLSYGNLPTAHTCFNQLCLPDYDTYEQFEKSLLLAINEGSAGFGLI